MLFALTILGLVVTLYVYCKVRAVLMKLKCLFKICKCCKCLLCACWDKKDKIGPGEAAEGGAYFTYLSARTRLPALLLRRTVCRCRGRPRL